VSEVFFLKNVEFRAEPKEVFDKSCGALEEV